MYWTLWGVRICGVGAISVGWTSEGVCLLGIRREAWVGPCGVSAYWKSGEKRGLDLVGCLLIGN